MQEELQAQQQPVAATPGSSNKKVVHFAASVEDGRAEEEAPEPGTCPTSKGVLNQLYSPSLPERQGSTNWTIEAQRSMQPQPEGGSALGDSSPAPSAYTPASASWLESARKVDDLRSRLEGLEQALKEMESKAVAHLDRSLQEKVLATAAKIVQKRFLADKELDKKLQQQVLHTAIKVVKRREAAAAAAAAEEASNPTRKLEFGQGELTSNNVQQYVAHIEQGLGEVVRRLEKKVDAVASLLDQNALELLEARLAGGLVRLEGRLAVLEEAQQQQQPAATSGATRVLLERLSAVEAAMSEQNRAVCDLLAALAAQATAAPTPAPAASQRQAAASPVAPSAASAARREEATKPPAAAAAAGQRSERAAADVAGPAAAAATAAEPPAAAAAAPAVAGSEPPAAAAAAPAAAAAAAAAREVREVAEPEQQLYQRRPGAVRRSILGGPSSRPSTSASAAGPRSAQARLKSTHSAGTAQQIAMATAREQLARQAQRAREQAEQETPVWLTMFYVFGWGILLLLGAAAVFIGMLAALVKSGRLTESDLEFLWQK